MWKIAPWSSRWFEDVSLSWVALIWVALIWVTFLSKFLLFYSTFTTWELILHTPKWNKFDQMNLLHIVLQQYPHINQKNWIKCHHSKLHTTDYISLIYFFHQIFVLSQIWSHFHIQPYFFCTSKFELFDPRNPKIQSFLNPSWCTIPNPNWTKEPKMPQIDPHLDHEIGVNILFIYPACGCFDLAWAQITQHTSNHLKPDGLCLFGSTISFCRPFEDKLYLHSKLYCIFLWHVRSLVYFVWHFSQDFHWKQRNMTTTHKVSDHWDSFFLLCPLHSLTSERQNKWKISIRYWDYYF